MHIQKESVIFKSSHDKKIDNIFKSSDRNAKQDNKDISG